MLGETLSYPAPAASTWARMFRLASSLSPRISCCSKGKCSSNDWQRRFGSWNCVLRFDADAASDVQAWRFHASQSPTHKDDGKHLVRFCACGLIEMTSHLASRGDSVQVVEPPQLREALQARGKSFHAIIARHTAAGRLLSSRLAKDEVLPEANFSKKRERLLQSGPLPFVAIDSEPHHQRWEGTWKQNQ